MLTPSMIARAWKDQEFRESLSLEDQSCLPAHPSGLIELTDEDLGIVLGGVTGNACTPTCMSNWYMCISDCPETVNGCGGGGGSHEGGCKPIPVGYGG
jgi:mersacidin/lichenicidin family type 2 lantibiotic